MTAPLGSVIDTMVLLKVLLMCAWPWATFLRSLRRTFFTAAPVRAFGGMRHALLITSLAGLLLTGDRALRTLAGTRVGMGPLTVNGQTAAVADALVAADLDLAADVGGDLAA